MFDFNGRGLIHVAGFHIPEGASCQSIEHKRCEICRDVYVGEVFLEQSCRIAVAVVLFFKIQTNKCVNFTIYSNSNSVSGSDSWPIRFQDLIL
jgi:hypothetical protein